MSSSGEFVDAIQGLRYEAIKFPMKVPSATQRKHLNGIYLDKAPTSDNQWAQAGHEKTLQGILEYLVDLE